MTNTVGRNFGTILATRDWREYAIAYVQWYNNTLGQKQPREAADISISKPTYSRLQ